MQNFKQQIGPSELEMGRGILDAAANAGIKHVVHASLPAATKLTQGRVSLTAFDGTTVSILFNETLVYHADDSRR